MGAYELTDIHHVQIAMPPGEEEAALGFYGDLLGLERIPKPDALADGYAGLVLPRSGLASRHGLTMANAPGLIDSGYRGELICAVVNLDREEAVKVSRGDRIAQLVIVAVPAFEPMWAEELPASSRGEGGFG